MESEIKNTENFDFLNEALLRYESDFGNIIVNDQFHVNELYNNDENLEVIFSDTLSTPIQFEEVQMISNERINCEQVRDLFLNDSTKTLTNYVEYSRSIFEEKKNRIQELSFLSEHDKTIHIQLLELKESEEIEMLWNMLRTSGF